MSALPQQASHTFTNEALIRFAELHFSSLNVKDAVKALQIAATLPLLERCIKVVEQAALDQRAEVREAAATACHHMRVSDRLRILQDLFYDPDPRVCTAAIRSCLRP